MDFRPQGLLQLVGVLVLVFAGCTSVASDPLDFAYDDLTELNAWVSRHNTSFEMTIQEAVAECMKEQGFDYVPYVSLGPSMELSESDTPITDTLEESVLARLDQIEGSNAAPANPNEKIMQELFSTLYEPNS